MVVIDVPVDVREDFLVFGWSFVEPTNVEAPNIRNNLTNLVDVGLSDVVLSVQSA